MQEPWASDHQGPPQRRDQRWPGAGGSYVYGRDDVAPPQGGPGEDTYAWVLNVFGNVHEICDACLNPSIQLKGSACAMRIQI